jgi:hypothetical protein
MRRDCAIFNRAVVRRFLSRHFVLSLRNRRLATDPLRAQRGRPPKGGVTSKGKLQEQEVGSPDSPSSADLTTGRTAIVAYYCEKSVTYLTV